jgi:hypothetical protein
MKISSLVEIKLDKLEITLAAYLEPEFAMRTFSRCLVRKGKNNDDFEATF